MPQLEYDSRVEATVLESFQMFQRHLHIDEPKKQYYHFFGISMHFKISRVQTRDEKFPDAHLHTQKETRGALSIAPCHIESCFWWPWHVRVCICPFAEFPSSCGFCQHGGSPAFLPARAHSCMFNVWSPAREGTVIYSHQLDLHIWHIMSDTLSPQKLLGTREMITLKELTGPRDKI